MTIEAKRSPEEEQGSQTHNQTTEDSHVVFALEGMTCASCAMRIEKGLKKVTGVKEASVNLATEQGTVTYDPTQTNVEQMIQKVETIGYKATALNMPAASLPEPAQASQSDKPNGCFRCTCFTGRRTKSA